MIRIKKLLLLVTLLFFFLPEKGNSQNVWIKRATVGGSKRDKAVGFSIGNRGYIGLGIDTLSHMPRDIWEYDPGTDTWTQKADYPTIGRREAVAFTIGNIAYVGTGIDTTVTFTATYHSDIWAFDPVLNTWTQKASYPGGGGFGVREAAAFSWGGYGYVTCGKLGPANYSAELWQYDPVGDVWNQKSYYPGGGRDSPNAFVIGNTAYVCMGLDVNNFQNDGYAYDPVNDIWSPIANFPSSGRFECSTFSLGGKGYVLLGTDGGLKADVWQYDPNTNYWTTVSPFAGGARKAAASFSIGNHGYAGTGGLKRDFYEFLPPLPMGVNELLEKNGFSFYPNPMTDYSTLNLAAELDPTKEEIAYTLYSADGKKLREAKITSSVSQINKDDLPPGAYLLSLHTATKIIGTQHLLIL